MAEYHVGCGCFGIYAGTLEPKNKGLWKNKTECTDEALCAVRDYLEMEFFKDGSTTGGYEWTRKDGSVVELRVTLKKRETDGRA